MYPNAYIFVKESSHACTHVPTQLHMDKGKGIVMGNPITRLRFIKFPGNLKKLLM
jgi:hypothetical protein